MKSKTHAGFLSFLMLTTATIPVTARAAPAAPNADGVADEIIVTAQKREQRLIDVPVGISVLGGQSLADRNVQTVNDLAYYVPGLSLRYDGPGSSQIFMRGAANIRGSDALVASYMDEVPVTLTGGFRQVDLRALDIDRVEVLKGPQGTLYGQGAMAGTVRYVTKDPSLTRTEGFVRGDLSIIDQGSINPKVTAAVGVPLVTDKLAIRVAADWEHGGGWIDQPALRIADGNNENVLNLRAKLLFRPSPDFDATATIVNYRMNSRFGLGYENDDRTRPVPLRPDYDLLPPRRDRAQIYNATMNYHASFATITSSTSYVRLNRDYATTYIAGPGTTTAGLGNEGFDGINDRAHQFTQELRLTAPKSSKLQYTLGAFYKDAHGNLDDQGISYFLGSTYPFAYRKYDASKSISLFVDASYELLPRLTIGGGARYFRDRQSAVDLAGTVQRATFHSVDPRIYMTYGLSAKWNIYANVSKGFRSGGFNSAGLPAYKPETLLNFEIGTKGESADGRLRFTLDGFYSKYDDALRTGQFFNFPSGYVSYTRNIGKLDIWGAEAELSYRVAPGLTLSLNGAYLDGEVTKVDINSAAGETANFRKRDGLDYAPKLSFTLAADYSVQLTAAAKGFLHADYVHRAKICATDDSILVPRTQCSQVIDMGNARAGVTIDSLTVEAYVTNITNENRVVDPYYSFSQSSHTKPRTIGMAVTRRF